jgi:hypothetical protein
MRTAAVIVSAFILLTATGADTPRPADDFAGKIVSVFIPDTDQCAVLDDVKIQKLGSREFLVGHRVRTADTKLPPVTVWYPLAEIKCMHVFNSFDDAEKSYPGWRKDAEKPQNGKGAQK